MRTANIKQELQLIKAILIVKIILTANIKQELQLIKELVRTLTLMAVRLQHLKTI
jgi:hypothetical protein